MLARYRGGPVQRPGAGVEAGAAGAGCGAQGRDVWGRIAKVDGVEPKLKAWSQR